jgi:hypothetical protein
MSKHALKVGNQIYKVKDMMDVCPFEGSDFAYLVDIRKQDDGSFEIDVISDGMGHTYSTNQFDEFDIEGVEVIEL